MSLVALQRTPWNATVSKCTGILKGTAPRTQCCDSFNRVVVAIAIEGVLYRLHSVTHHCNLRCESGYFLIVLISIEHSTLVFLLH